MLKPSIKSLSIAVFAVATTLSASSVFAASWAQTHPRRAQVNQRLEHENRRINHEYAQGEIGKARAIRLHRQAHHIRAEERRMASRHGGHITLGEQRQLNRQEDRLSRRIGS